MNFIAGLLLGIFVTTGTGAAVAATQTATPSTSPIYVDGKQVQMKAYNIAGSNYVKLRDIGQQVGFNVYWDAGVRVDSQSPYTGVAPLAGADPDVKEEAVDMDAVRDEMVHLINQVRRENGVPALKVDQRLMDAAQECSAMQFTWHHNREECETVAASGYPYGFGSNLTAFTGVSKADIAQHAVENWVNSPGHFETLIDPMCDSIGVGVTEDGGRTYCYMFAGAPNTYNPYG